MAKNSFILVNRSLYHMGVVTLVTSILWVGIGVYNAFSNHGELEIAKETLTPFNPGVDLAVLETLRSRRSIKVDEATTTIIEGLVEEDLEESVLTIEQVEEASGSGQEI